MKRTPNYCHHKATGQAYATINGKVVYFGEHGTAESKNAYDRAIVQWRELHANPHQTTTIGQLSVVFIKQHATDYYSPGELANYRAALKVLIAMFRTTRVCEFGPKKLKAVQDALAAKHVRIQVNNSLSRIKRMFEWGVSQEIVSATTFLALKTVKNLKRGRSKAKEGQPVLPVPQEHLDATLPELTPTVRSMVKMQLLTGMRPGEVLKMRVKELDTTGEVWVYRPDSHKNSWRLKQRVIYIGPRGQDVLLSFLIGRKPGDYLFNPHDSGHHVRNSQPGENIPYSSHGYISGIYRGCKKAGVPKWSPGQLRHNAATNVNSQAGDIDAARVMLGHSEKSTTEIYAERDFTKAAEIAKQFG